MTWKNEVRYKLKNSTNKKNAGEQNDFFVCEILQVYAVLDSSTSLNSGVIVSAEFFFLYLTA